MTKTFLSSGAEQLRGVSGLPEDICIQDYGLGGNISSQVALSPESVHLMCSRLREKLQALGVCSHRCAGRQAVLRSTRKATYSTVIDGRSPNASDQTAETGIYRIEALRKLCSTR